MDTADTISRQQQKLDLLMALDKARDSVEAQSDPDAMFQAIVTILREYFQADTCAIMLMLPETQTVECLAHSGVSESVAIEMCRKSLQLQEPTVINSDIWPNNLGIHIIHDMIGESLGGLFLARKNRSFEQTEVDLLKFAESQIDSAVLQARTIWNLAKHNLQMEAIYQIDRMRDDNPEEHELINNFVAILDEYFGADIVMISLSHIDSGEMVLRGLIDRENLPIETLEAIHELTSNITLPQVIQPIPHIDRIMLLAAPFVVSGVRLGSVVVGREKMFTIADQRLLYAMMSQMDSAIVHSRVIQQLTQRNRELEAIYRIDHIRDSDIEFDQMMQQVLIELCEAVNSELGYLMLFSEDEERQLQLKAATTADILASPIYYDIIKSMSRKALDAGNTVFSNKPNGPVRSIVSVPLILNARVIGVFGTVNSRNPRGFTAEDRRMLTAITSQVDTAIFERLERRRMRRVLSRSVDPKVLDKMLTQTHDTILKGERVVLSVLFADLRSSTEWAERTDPEELVTTLNLFLGNMTDIIFAHGGTLDKFVGDEVIALFGSPVPMDDHALQAARCALEMQNSHQELRDSLEQQGIELPAMGIGISTGEVIAGEFGPSIRTDFTAIGKAMNMGSRLCSSAGAGQVYISPLTYEMICTGAEVRKLDSQNLKGIGNVQVFELLRLLDAE